MYVTVTVLVEGALEYEGDMMPANVKHRVAYEKAQAQEDGQKTEVYLLTHDHAPHEDCCCAQYMTDHHPRYVFP